MKKKTTMLETPMIPNDKKVEEVKMLSETIEPLLDLDKCILLNLSISYKSFLMTHPLMFIKQVLAPT
jgi:hypothetical protein